MRYGIRSALITIAAGMLLGSGAALAESNACKADLNGDLVVNFGDLAVMKSVFFQRCPTPPRFEDRGLTVFDHQTGLEWEKKTAEDTVPDPSDPHDVDNPYAWSNAGSAPNGPAFTEFLAALNNCIDDGTNPPTAVTGGFAGRCDWRMPTIVELQTILDQTLGSCGGGSGYCMDPVFGPATSGYWSATTFASTPTHAWTVSFGNGSVGDFGVDKTFYGFGVRAVRGGL